MNRTRVTERRAAAGVAGLLLLTLAACGDGTSPEPAQPPIIDGVRAPGEWDGATVFRPTSELIPGHGPSTILITTDGTNLYVALEITDQAEGDDRFEVRFDNDNNNLLTDGDDLITLDAAGTLVDGHYSASAGAFTGDDASQDGEGAVGQDGGTAFYEFSHPLNTGDADDLAVGIGDVIGMCFRYFDAGASNSGAPGACFLALNQQATYLEVAIELP